MRSRILFLIWLGCFISISLIGRGLDEIKRSGKIYIAFTSDDIRNINYPLAKEFARYLNVEMVEVEIEWEEVFMQNGIVPKNKETDPSITFTPDALKKADIICSTFTILDWRKKFFDFAETLQSAELLMISKKQALPRHHSDLIGKTITFQRETTFESNLKEINMRQGGGIILRPTESGQEAKDLLISGKAYGIVLDADEALNFNALNDYAFKIAFPVSNVTKTAWAVERNNPLKQEVENFFETIASNGVLDEIFYDKFQIHYSTFVNNINKNLRYEKQVRDLDQILESKTLIVALRDRNFIYRSDGQKQFMHALAEEFADYLGVSLDIIVTPYFSKYWEDESGELYRDSSYTPDWFNYFDIACEVFAPLDWRTNKIEMVPVYPSEYAVIARKETDIQDLEDLQDLTCVTGEKTVYEDMLNDAGLKDFYFEKVNNFLPDVLSGKADYTILYNAFYELSKFPELEVKMTLGELNVCWGIRKDQSLLKKELETFLETSSQNGLISVLMKSLQGKTLQTPDAFINSYYESFQTGQLPYVNYGADDGLPQEDIFSIFQDHKGYVWFGTNSGAVRYNGREMVVFDDQQGLPANSVRDIKQDSSGYIYLATTNGIALLNNDTVVKSYFKGISFKKIYVDSKNRKWLIGDDGIYYFNSKGTEISLNRKFPMMPELIYSFLEDKKSGEYYIATSEGVFRLDKSLNRIDQINDLDCFSIFIDVNDSIWFATKTGLFISSVDNYRSGKDDIPLYNLNERLDFPVEIISEITTNNFGSVWLISDSKLLQVNSTDQKPIVYEQEIGIRNNKILSFLADKEDNIWIGFSGGLQRLTNRRGLRNFYPNTINTYIYSIFQDPQDRTWIISNKGVYYFKKELKEFKPRIGVDDNKKLLATLLPNGNILFASSFGVYEVSSKTLEIVRFSQFPQLALSLENLFISSSGEIFLLTGINGVIYYLSDFYSHPVQLKNRNTSNVFQLAEYNGRIIGGNSTDLVAFNGNDFDLLLETECNIWSLLASDTMLWIGTDCGLGRIYNSSFDQLEMSSYEENLVIKTIIAAKNKNFLWIGTNRGFLYYNIKTRETDFRIDTKDGLSGDEITSRGLFLDKNDLLWIGTYHGLSNFNIRAKSFNNYAPVCYIENLLINGIKTEPLPGLTCKHNRNNFVFEISALSFTDERSVEYEYYLRGSGHNYSSYHRGKEFKAYYNNLPPGDYQFIYKAKGKNNIWGYADNFNFTIRKAWYNTWVFYILLSIFILSFIYFLYRMRVQAIQAQKKKLERQVRERTLELEEANTEIEAQRDLATEQRDRITVQQKSIMDSIQYAKRIQRSMLPSEKILKILLPEHFIIFKPRDIVSGDFYWATGKNNTVYFTAADCTGHGVPGAFMSMLGMGLLNEIINKYNDVEPDEIMNQLRKHLIKALHQKGLYGETKDGMDMVMCKYNTKTRRLSFAGANNPLYLISKGKLIETKGDSMPVAIHDTMDPFTLHSIQILPGDRIFIFSDGYADQFGGEKMKKFLYKRFREKILETGSLDIKAQGKALNEAFENWKGSIEQVDDVVLIGIEF